MERLIGIEMISGKDWDNKNPLLNKKLKGDWNPVWLTVKDINGELKIEFKKMSFSEMFNSIPDRLPRRLLFLRIFKNKVKFKLLPMLKPYPTDKQLSDSIVKKYAIGWLLNDRDALVEAKAYSNVLRHDYHFATNYSLETLHPYINMCEYFGDKTDWDTILKRFEKCKTPKQKMKEWSEIEKVYFDRLVI